MGNSPQVRGCADNVAPARRFDARFRNTAEHLEPLKSLLRNLKLSLADILEEQLYQERRDVVHYVLNESTDKRAVMTAVVETMAIVAVTVTQVVYIRKLFAKRQGLLPRFGV